MSGRPLNQYVVEGRVYWSITPDTESCREGHVCPQLRSRRLEPDAQATIFYRKTGLRPLDIGEVNVGNGADAVSEQVVEFL